jgi:hypothetical protein
MFHGKGLEEGWGVHCGMLLAAPAHPPAGRRSGRIMGIDGGDQSHLVYLKRKVDPGVVHTQLQETRP